MTLLAATAIDYTPFYILAAGVVFVLFTIIKLRLHPFIGLTLGAIIVGLLTPGLPELTLANGFWGDKEGASNLIKAINWSMAGFGTLVGKIGFVIAMAAIIGMCMMESGAADKIVRRLLASLGEDRASWAMLLSGFILSIPVFFDTVFFLLIPLARALALRTGKNYTLYVCAICAGGALTHTIVPPTPGPLIIAENLSRPAGEAIIAGLCAAIIPVLVAMWYCRRLNVSVNVPLRETKGAPIKDLEAIVKKKDDELPSFGLSMLPVLLPVVLISAVTFIGLFVKMGISIPADLKTWLEFVGDKNLAMMLGAIIAMYTLAKQRGWTLGKMGESMSSPLETAGVIILITGAGGAFGSMIAKTGLRGTIEQIGSSGNTEGGMSTIALLLIAWVLTAVIRAAQGSATVAMITGSGIMAPIIASGIEQLWLPCHPIYFCLVIGFGAFPLSWMNDSGFWVVQRMSGFTEKETLQTWTKLLTLIGVVGLVQVLAFATVLPLWENTPNDAPPPSQSAIKEELASTLKPLSTPHWGTKQRLTGTGAQLGSPPSAANPSQTPPPPAVPARVKGSRGMAALHAS